jgi:hypothetical protein
LPSFSALLPSTCSMFGKRKLFFMNATAADDSEDAEAAADIVFFCILVSLVVLFL